MLPPEMMFSVVSAVDESAKPKKSSTQIGSSSKKNEKTREKTKEKTAVDDFDEFEEGGSGLGYQFIINGFVELENIVNTYTKQEPGDSNKKNEIRVKLNMQAGSEKYYFKCVPNIYALPLYLKDGFYDDYHYNEDNFEISRNGRISGEYYEASFNECFVNAGFDYMRFRLGNQIYAWGTCDVFNPTSFINPSDSRELFFKDADETTLGVPSLSSMIFLSDLTLELVFIPLHVGAISPVSENFWAYHYDIGFMTIVEDKYEPLPAGAENIGYGARLAGSFSGVDISLSFYRGPDANPILRPIDYIPETSDILVRQEYHTSTNFGGDFSFKLWKFEIHGEMAYSPDKYGVVDETPTGFTFEDDSAVLNRPFSIKTSKWYSYSTGLNFIYNNLTLTSEWVQGKNLDKSLMGSYYSDLIAGGISYSFFDGSLDTTLAALYDVKHEGYVLMPSINYKINDISVKLAYSHISNSPSDEITMFSLFKKHDILIIGVRYEF